ncbi:hypothetical protein FJY94_02885 [Candidatus Kaiserbacteria bacterium]|nr:hypothetical protein [Candidatus Kaiserbacteria bacterium]
MRHNRGFSVIEIVIAAAIGMTVTTAAALVAFGGQSAVAGFQTDAAVLAAAERMLEDARARSLDDMSRVVPVPASVQDGIETELAVELLSDQVTRRVTARATAVHGVMRTHAVSLTTLMTGRADADAPDTCAATLSTWTDTAISDSVSVGDSAVAGPVMGIDALGGRVALAAGNGGVADFYLYEQDDDGGLRELASADIVPGSVGLAGVVMLRPERQVAFTLSAAQPNFTTCTEGPACAHLMVVALDPGPRLVHSVKVPGVRGAGGQGRGKSIAYHDGRLYIGLAKTGGGPEFVIFDARESREPRYLGGFSVGAGVESIVVAGDLAYIATDDSARELLILDVHNPSAPQVRGVYDAPGPANFGYGNIVRVRGEELTLGRTYAPNAAELAILGVQEPLSPTHVLSYDSGTTQSPQSINGIAVDGPLTFLVTTDYLQLWQLRHTSGPVLLRQFDIGASGAVGSAGDCDGETFYAGGYRTDNHRGMVYAITAAHP